MLQDPLGIQSESIGSRAPSRITVADLEVKGSSAKAQTAGLKDRRVAGEDFCSGNDMVPSSGSYCTR